MMKAELSREIVIRIPNKLGLLSEVCGVVADQESTILTATCLVEENDAIFHLVASNHDRVLQAFKKNKLDVREEPMVLVEITHQRGLFSLLTGTLKEAGIDIHHLNATALSSIPRCLVALSCSDNARAVEVINRKAAAIPTGKKFEYHSAHLDASSS